MHTALDEDPENLHPEAREFVAGIRRYGWMATYIYPTETSTSFTYTTGLCALKAMPELILFGLPMETAHGVLTEIVRRGEAGVSLPAGKPIPGLLMDVDVCLFETTSDAHANYALRSVWFYDTAAFPCRQLVIPDLENRFPWQAGCDARLIAMQPDLTERGWLASLSA